MDLKNIRYIVGLGNPGREYSNSPHNLGFMFIDMLRKQLLNLQELNLSKQNAWQVNKIILSKPNTYMNKSGEAINELRKHDSRSTVEFVNSILVIHDDVELPMYTMKYKNGRVHQGLGGHNGLRSIVNSLTHLGLKIDDACAFHRLRMGCSAARHNLADYITAPMSKESVLRWLEAIDSFLLNFWGSVG
jgi:peptidyl-tRNA hydrolase, PTH1 family